MIAIMIIVIMRNCENGDMIIMKMIIAKVLMIIMMVINNRTAKTVTMIKQ